MPIEIRELHIKVSVTNPDASHNGNKRATADREASDSTTNNTEQIVAACVEKVMEILKNKTER